MSKSCHMQAIQEAIGSIWSSRQIVDDFEMLCSFDGRFAGTPGEQRAVEFLRRRLLQIGHGGSVSEETIPYLGWTRGTGTIALESGRVLHVNPLGRSPSTPAGGLRGEVIDLGRGAPGDFAAAADSIAGKIVLVRHEYMQNSGYIHRRRKLEMAKAHGAAGYLIACNLPGGLSVTGSAGTGDKSDITCAGVTFEDGIAISQGGEVVLNIQGEFENRTATNLFLDFPGKTSEFVVLSAHIDGHHLAESAIDNASGLSCALAVAEAVGRHIKDCRRGLRVAFFNVEEWALIGSREHLSRLSSEEKNAFVFNINLDSVAGCSRVSAMTSAIPASEALIHDVNRKFGFGLGLYRPFSASSDHSNYVLNGIPAVRLVAGLDMPESNSRFILTSGDTKDKVAPVELKTVAAIATALVLCADDLSFPRLSSQDIQKITGTAAI